ncbi:MAG: radical SAM protein [Coriobacteriia bacterium]|nr:radical SAM protein [Coriobacteriia bacterium]
MGDGDVNAQRSHLYGPVPSRRLGRSLGIDLVPFKTCTYDCVYCQLGRTTHKTMERQHYVPVDEIMAQLRCRLQSIERPDYITLAGSGEPTLNAGIGDLIGRIKESTDIPVAVLTNGSLLWMREVADSLMGADLVVPSLDAGDAELFERVNRPCEGISFGVMVEGISEFTTAFSGEVWLEVFLVEGVTSAPAEVSKIAVLVERIRPARTQLNTAWRPPAEADVRPVSGEDLERLSLLLPGTVDITAERTDSASTAGERSSVRDDEIVSLVERRPCTAEDIATGLGMHVAEVLKRLDVLRVGGAVTTTVRGDRTFYISG